MQFGIADPDQHFFNRSTIRKEAFAAIRECSLESPIRTNTFLIAAPFAKRPSPPFRSAGTASIFGAETTPLTICRSAPIREWKMETTTMMMAGFRWIGMDEHSEGTLGRKEGEGKRVCS